MSTRALTVPVTALGLAGATLAQSTAERVAMEKGLKVSVAVADHFRKSPRLCTCEWCLRDEHRGINAQGTNGGTGGGSRQGL